MGLNKIMEISVPVLNVLYPVAIVLILLAFFHGCLRRFPLVYPFGIGMTVLVSLASVLCKTFGETCFLTVLIRRLPLEKYGAGMGVSSSSRDLNRHHSFHTQSWHWEP